MLPLKKFTITKIAIVWQFLGLLQFTKLSEASSDMSNGCSVYSETDFLGEPIATLKNLDTIYDISLISANSGVNKGAKKNLHRGPEICATPLSANNISTAAKSIRLYQNCGLFTCTLPKFHGDCSEHFISSTNITEPIEFQSAICQCSSSSDLLESKPLQNKKDGCAVLYKDWNFSGKGQKILFPGTAGRIQSDLKSAKVRENCSLTLWKHLPKENKQVSLSLESSTSYLKPPTDGQYEWYCCYCDTNSEAVCKNAKESELTIPAEETEENKIQTDFSEFVKYGKKIIGIGRNYRWKKSELAKVLKEPSEPIVFMKPTTSYIVEGQKIELLESLGTIFYEIELGVVIGKKGRSIPKNKALDYVAGYFLALDMTAKGFLKKSVNQSLPWEIGKGFDTACPVGHFIPKNLIPNPNNIDLLCKVNGNVTQSDNTSGMIFNVEHLISYISRFMTLEPYDVIVTGTPDGLGPLHPGDVIEGQLGNLTTIRFEAVGVNDVNKTDTIK